MAQKKTTTKSAAEKARVKAEKERLEQIKRKREQERFQISAILLLAFAVFLLAATFISGEKGWLALHNVMFGLFGPVAYAVGPLLMYVAIVTAFEKRMPASKILFAVLLLISICGAMFIFEKRVLTAETFYLKIVELYELGVLKIGGGVLSAVFGWSLFELFGTEGAGITIVILMFVFVMLLTGKTIKGIVDNCREAAEAAKARREEYLLEQEEQRQRRLKIVDGQNSGIDIPLDGIGSEKKSKKANIDIPLDAGPVQLKTNPLERKNAPSVDIDLGPDYLPVKEPTTEDNVRDFFDSLGADSDPHLDELIHKVEEQHKKPQADAPSTMVASAPELGEYKFPPISLLKKGSERSGADLSSELRATADKLVKTLESFGVMTKIVDISRGPTVTRYELQPNSGVKISKISSLADDIALNLATAGVRIEAPIPNKSAVGIEVPNRDKSIVTIRSIIESRAFKDAKDPLTVALGKDIDGEVRIADIAKMPHMLVAGATNSGKSVCLNSMIMSIFYKSSPADVRLILIDPKSVELIGYNGIPHLLVPVVTDPKKASGALGWAVGEMMKRYKLFAEKGVKNLESYNNYVDAHPHDPDSEEEPLQKLPRILIIIDELSDLMMAAPNEVEDAICRLAQLARAAGMHLIVATQRPSVDVVTGLIKANIPSRVAFAVSSQIDSRTILGGAGAEKLLGRGDMLYMPMDLNKPVRLQGCYVSEEETAAVIGFIKESAAEQYNEGVMAEIDKQAANAKGSGRGATYDGDEDELFDSAVEVGLECGQMSTSMLQRKLKLGYARAARIVDSMQEKGLVGPADGAKPREMRITRQQWLEHKLSSGE